MTTTSRHLTPLQVPPVPEMPIRSRIARALFAHAVRVAGIRAEFPDGREVGAADDPVLRIAEPGAFFARLARDGKIGFGESYMCGEWDADDLPELLTALARRLPNLIPKPLQSLRRRVDRAHPAAEANTLAGSRSNIHRHYDLPPELFAAFLDETMTYSSALYGPGDSLARAQQRKIDAVLDLAKVGPGTRMLEIGTGWGSLALAAAARGADVTSLTISAEQQRLAAERIATAGFTDRARVLLRDYREEHGSYDAIVSVEMLEAVGERYWPAYFAALHRLCRPSGRIALQTITMPHDRLIATRRSYTWIHKYVFPGGLIPSIPAIEGVLTRHSDLRIISKRELGPDYARTLAAWRANFAANEQRVRALGYDDIFLRMWDFYLAYSQAGFASGYLGNVQLALAHQT